MNEDDKKQAEAFQRKARLTAAHLKEGGMQCNCDLDNWEPEWLTGHSWVCRIHKATLRRLRG